MKFKLLTIVIGAALVATGLLLTSNYAPEVPKELPVAQTGVEIVNTLQDTLLKQSDDDVSRVTLYEFETCRVTKCMGLECKDGDTQCYQASEEFVDCTQNDQSCQNWFLYYSTMYSDDTMPIDFYDCGTTCRPNPNTSRDYWKIYSCWASCGGVNLPTIEEFEACRNTECKSMCGNDANCNKASYQHLQCYQNTQVCQIYQNLIVSDFASDPLPAQFYQCDRICRPDPALSQYYYEHFYECVGQCAGVDYSLDTE